MTFVSSIMRAGAIVTLLLASWPAAVHAQTLNVGIIGASTDAPFFIADAKGYFRDEGLNVKLTQFNSAAAMTAPLATGELQAGAGAPSVSLYNAASQGIVLKIVADKAQYGTTFNHASLMVRKALVDSGRFKDYKDLKGLKVAVTGRGSGDESVLNEALKRGGLKWGDAEPVYLGFAQHLPAFVNGAIDASLTAEPFVSTIMNSGGAVRFVSNDKFYPKQQSSVLIYGAPFIKNQADAAMKFMRAARFYNDAVANASLSGPNGPEVIDILVKYSTLKDAAVYRAITPPSLDPDVRLNMDSLRKDWQFFKDTGQIDGKVTPDDVVDRSFAEKAATALGPYRPAVPR